MRKTFRPILLLVLATLLLAGCGNGKNGTPGQGTPGNGTGPDNGPTGVPGGDVTEDEEYKKRLHVFNDIFSGGGTFAEDWAFLTARNGGGARYFDVASRTDVLYCFDPSCEHKGPTWSAAQKTVVNDNCPAYNLGNMDFSLREDCGYYFEWPNMVKTDRQGMNQKVIGTADEPMDFYYAELYTEDHWFTSTTICYEHTKVQDADGTERWVMGDRLEKQIAGIYMMSLKDGKGKFIFKNGEDYSSSTTSIYVYDGHLYFTHHSWDLPFDQLPHPKEDGSDWEEFALEQGKHVRVAIYDYNIATDELTKIWERDGKDEYVGEIRFGNGFILQAANATLGVPAALYNLKGEFIRELPFAAGELVCTDGTPIFQVWADGRYTYIMYDVEKDQILRQTSFGESGFVLHIAAGKSYYGLVNGAWEDGMHRAYISEEDFWNNNLENKVVFHVGREGQ